MSASSESVSRSWGFRRYWKLVTAAGAGGSAIIWLEELLLAIQEIASAAVLCLLALPIYLLNIFAFRSRMPRREDLVKPYGEHK